MGELLIEYGQIPAYIIIAFFLFFWISIPWYLGECAKTRILIDKIERNEKVTFRDLEKNTSNLAGLQFAFGYSPSEQLFPHLYKNLTFKKHIIDLKKLQRFYKKAAIIIAILLVLLFLGRVYVVKLEKQNNSTIEQS